MISIDPKKIRIMAVVGNAVLTKALLTLGIGFLGYKLDEKLGTKPWLCLLGIVVGLSLGLWYLIAVAIPETNNPTTTKFKILFIYYLIVSGGHLDRCGVASI